MQNYLNECQHHWGQVRNSAQLSMGRASVQPSTKYHRRQLATTPTRSSQHGTNAVIWWAASQFPTSMFARGTPGEFHLHPTLPMASKFPLLPPSSNGRPE